MKLICKCICTLVVLLQQFCLILGWTRNGEIIVATSDAGEAVDVNPDINVNTLSLNDEYFSVLFLEDKSPYSIYLVIYDGFGEHILTSNNILLTPSYPSKIQAITSSVINSNTFFVAKCRYVFGRSQLFYQFIEYDSISNKLILSNAFEIDNVTDCGSRFYSDRARKYLYWTANQIYSDYNNNNIMIVYKPNAEHDNNGMYATVISHTNKNVIIEPFLIDNSQTNINVVSGVSSQSYSATFLITIGDSSALYGKFYSDSQFYDKFVILNERCYVDDILLLHTFDNTWFILCDPSSTDGKYGLLVELINNNDYNNVDINVNIISDLEFWDRLTELSYFSTYNVQTIVVGSYTYYSSTWERINMCALIIKKNNNNEWEIYKDDCVSVQSSTYYQYAKHDITSIKDSAITAFSDSSRLLVQISATNYSSLAHQSGMYDATHGSITSTTSSSKTTLSVQDVYKSKSESSSNALGAGAIGAIAAIVIFVIAVVIGIVVIIVRKRYGKDKETKKYSAVNANEEEQADKVVQVVQVVRVIEPEQQPVTIGKENEDIRTFMNKTFNVSVDAEKYYQLFIKNGVDDLQTIKILNQKDLIDIGIDKIGHRKKIISAASGWQN